MAPLSQLSCNEGSGYREGDASLSPAARIECERFRVGSSAGKPCNTMLLIGFNYRTNFWTGSSTEGCGGGGIKS